MDPKPSFAFRIKKYLPSKKIMAIIGILVIAAAAYWGIPRIREYYQTHRASFSVTGKPPAPLIASGGTPTAFDRDTDGDQIPDWQEKLFGFDPEKADSDSDGVNDVLPTVGGTSIGELVEFDDFGKLTSNVYAKFETTPTEEITPEAVSDATQEELLAQAESIEKSFKTYQMVDLVLADSDAVAVAAYNQSIKGILDSVADPALFAKSIQETILTAKPASAGDVAFLNSTITKLLATEVPGVISDLHLSVINSLYYLVQVLQMPPGDELSTYTRSIIAQKNMNVIQKTVVDIAVLGAVYQSNAQ